MIFKLIFHSKRASDIYIKFVSDEKDAVKDIVVHPNFVKTMDTLQDNIVSLNHLKNSSSTIPQLNVNSYSSGTCND